MRRAASPPERSMHGVSKALVYQQDAYLLQLRDCVPTISYPDRWSFFGGEIELGESPWQALQRELEEELEWRPHCGRFLYEWINPENPCRIHFLQCLSAAIAAHLSCTRVRIWAGSRLMR
ncbi:MAG: hypothetical protein Ct9H300mP16_11200 [Pseudomonadota bacterium]|nr:MAG: hypothetical protein Ct9H300mP16_11200 [Pseudomonadota bacterium]